MMRRVIKVSLLKPSLSWEQNISELFETHHESEAKCKAFHARNFCFACIECVHDGHVGGPKQYNDFSLGNIFYFYANIFYCFSPPTWPPCTHSI